MKLIVTYEFGDGDFGTMEYDKSEGPVVAPSTTGLMVKTVRGEDHYQNWISAIWQDGDSDR